MADPSPPSQRWWGTFSIPLDQVAHWRIGPLDLWVQRLRNEWRVARDVEGDPGDDSVFHRVPAERTDLADVEGMARFGLSDTKAELVMAAAPADRPVITSPERPFRIPAGEEATVYVSTPLWAQLFVREGHKLLVEQAVVRPSDTWFGASTLVGELCYTSRTYFVLHSENLPRLPHRATTAVRIENHGADTLPVDRLRLPAPQLGLYETADGQLWTQDVLYERKAADEFAELTVRPRGPSGVGRTKRVAEPREPGDSNPMVRAFSSLFQRREG